jgi:hypothetical protein
MDPRTMISFPKWCKKIAPMLAAGQKFKSKAPVDMYALLLGWWHGMLPEDKRQIVRVIDKHNGFTPQCCQELKTQCRVPFNDQQIVHVCYEMAKQNLEQLEMAVPSDDSIHVAIHFLGLYETSSDPSDPTSPYLCPYFAAYTSFQRYLARGDLPPSFASSFRANYFTALHKDPTNLVKLCPLGIGFSWRRLLASTILKHLSSDFAAYLLPQGQLGVGVPGGLDTIVHLTRAAIESHIADLQAAGCSPTHALLLLDKRQHV